MTPDDVARQFTRSDGSYVFARWGRPIAPVVFGVEDQTLSVMKGALQAVADLARHPVVETDPELGVNFMVFFLREWDELRHVPDLGRLIPDLESLLPRLEEAGANQYRAFRFEEDGAIRAAFVFVRMDDEMSALPAEIVALSQVVQTILLWSDTAFSERSALAEAPDGTVILRPEIGRLIRAAYDPVMPRATTDGAHAYRLSARIGG
ncbi:hypothetical protein SAMN04488020_10789 [Palleronia marisminoris]|uniref:Uncharacterized protein n=1 Tax=Palleronia marisminoris TaxID=315423 RepID=A0A1Y5T518_9RHOB|nr:hypothetical protein [Palleronia marisminoris]SFH14398.1 hypothetical protein SAMN04488020_10789 [Palleronia marisminoris]SLN54304.1 hypothetical protein PAM7066_02562 [Palleronia marisminoris]